jgi:hypothetical protein
MLGRGIEKERLQLEQRVRIKKGAGRRKVGWRRGNGRG